MDSQDQAAQSPPEAPEKPRKRRRRRAVVGVMERLAEAQKAQSQTEKEIAKLTDVRVKEIGKEREALLNQVAELDAELEKPNPNMKKAMKLQRKLLKRG